MYSEIPDLIKFKAEILLITLCPIPIPKLCPSGWPCHKRLISTTVYAVDHSAETTVIWLREQLDAYVKLADKWRISINAAQSNFTDTRLPWSPGMKCLDKRLDTLADPF